MKCGAPAHFRYTWPGRDESFLCDDHVKGLKRVAETMGLYVQLIPMEGDLIQGCRQEVKDGENEF